MRFLVSPPKSNERDPWAHLWRAYLRFYEADLPADQFDRVWSDIQSDNGTVRCLLARTEQGEAAGLAHFLFHGSAWVPAQVCYLQDLFISPQHRKSGIGQQLIQAVASTAQARQAAKLYWLTQQSNSVARALYDKIARNTGFVRYELTLDQRAGQ